MKRMSLLVLPVLVLLALGCQNGPELVDTSNVSSLGLAAGIAAGGAVASATFNIYVSGPSDKTVDVHRITASWDEMTVTWANFGGAFDANIEGSYQGVPSGWHSVDVTTLVQDWLNGTYENYGLLIDQVNESYPRVMYESREGAHPPYLEICYETADGMECVQVESIADAFIWEIAPTYNFGDQIALFTGWYNETDLEKQSVIRFDLPVTPELAAIGDYVWIDMNEDGIQDAGEPGLPDVTVNLYNCLDELLATTTTDANGYYLFDNLMPGDYYVEFIAPEGYIMTAQDQGADDAVDSDADPVTGRTICTTLDAGETDLTWDAGMYLRTSEGCTLTIGFWKTHAGFGPQADVVTPLLPIWLGDAGGSKSIEVTDAATAVDILKMKTYGHPSNGITKLYAQLLGAKLNFANGADGSAVEQTVNEADAFLAENDWTIWDSLSKSQQKTVLKLKSKLDDYNNGIIGPGHCDDMGDDD